MTKYGNEEAVPLERLIVQARARRAEAIASIERVGLTVLTYRDGEPVVERRSSEAEAAYAEAHCLAVDRFSRLLNASDAEFAAMKEMGLV